MARPRRRLLGCLGVLGLALLALVIWIGPLARDLYSKGFFEKTERRRYTGDSAANLRALHTAMMLYHDSEERFPDASGWMDAIKHRIKTADLIKGEEEKKLIRPDLLNTPGAYGYAISDDAAGKYKDDVAGGSKAILIFESRDTGRNAHGDPKTAGLPNGAAIRVDGTLVKPEDQP